MSCKCDMRTKLVGDGCKHYNPQHYIDVLEDKTKYYRAELDKQEETIRTQQAEIDRLTEQRDRLLKALGDLSFECFGGGVGTCQPSVKTYNDTFAVLDEIRKGIS